MRALASALFLLALLSLSAPDAGAQPTMDPEERAKFFKSYIENVTFQIGGDILNPSLYARRAWFYRQLYIAGPRATTDYAEKALAD